MLPPFWIRYRHQWFTERQLSESRRKDSGAISHTATMVDREYQYACIKTIEFAGEKHICKVWSLGAHSHGLGHTWRLSIVSEAMHTYVKEYKRFFYVFCPILLWVCNCSIIHFYLVGEMAYQLGLLSSQDSHWAAFNSTSYESSGLMWPLGASLHTCIYVHTDTQLKYYVNKQNENPEIWSHGMLAPSMGFYYLNHIPGTCIHPIGIHYLYKIWVLSWMFVRQHWLEQMISCVSLSLSSKN